MKLLPILTAALVCITACEKDPKLSVSASAGPDQIIYAPRQLTILEGSGNYQTWANWRQISGDPGAVIETPSYRLATVNKLKVGNYQFELELKLQSNNGITARDTVQITVIKPVPANGQIVFPEQPVDDDWDCYIHLEKITDFLPAGSVIKEVFISEPGKNDWKPMPNIKTNPNGASGYYEFDAALNTLNIHVACNSQSFQDIKITY